MTALKIKFAIGNGIFEYEGPFEKLEPTIALIKTSVIDELSQASAPPVTVKAQDKSSRKSKKPKTKSAKKPRATMDTQTAKQVDFRAIANSIKESDKTDLIRKHFILKEGDYLNKAKLVMLHSDEPLTTGDIERIYRELGVRVPLPSVSKAMSAQKSQFFLSSDTPARYSLTAPTKADFKTYFENLGDVADA